jgi:hypothetical protein
MDCHFTKHLLTTTCFVSLLCLHQWYKHNFSNTMKRRIKCEVTLNRNSFTPNLGSLASKENHQLIFPLQFFNDAFSFLDHIAPNVRTIHGDALPVFLWRYWGKNIKNLSHDCWDSNRIPPEYNWRAVHTDQLIRCIILLCGIICNYVFFLLKA